MVAHVPRCASFEECVECYFAPSEKAKEDLKERVVAALFRNGHGRNSPVVRDVLSAIEEVPK